MNREAREVAAWLSGLPKTTALPVEVTIGRTTYSGAFYAQTREHIPGSRAYLQGEREYTHSALYLLGDVPASYRRGRVAYVFEDDGVRRWYVAGYFPPRGGGIEKNAFHPFGPMFQLMRDSHGVTDDERVTVRARMTRVKP